MASSSGGGGGGESVVVDVGRRKNTCGYCKSDERSSISHGLWAHSLTVDHYQALLDRGWRRSGCYLYKPEMEKTCCPSYTIRLNASDFAPSKEQIRVAKRMRRFLDGTRDVKKRDEGIHRPNMCSDMCNLVSNATTSFGTREPCIGEPRGKSKTEQYTQHLSVQIDNAVRAVFTSREIPCSSRIPKACVKIVAPSKRKLLGEGSEELLFTSNVSFQIAASLRRTEKDISGSKPSSVVSENHDRFLELSPNMFAEKITSYLNQMVDSSGLLIRSCNGHINFYSSTKQPWLDDVVEKVSVSKKSSTVNGLNASCARKVSDCTQEKGKTFELRLNRSSFDPEEYALYRKYQIEVHNDMPDHVTESSYKRFLVDTPLTYVPSTGDGTVPPCGFGSFHQQYIIDGRLVAVGIIDILPKCLSSKYLFWDPEFAFLSLGKYSALQEINWVKENELKCPSLGYYYLGYYIHSCNKMRYKAAYSPSELLCPLRYQWVPFQIVKPLLDRKPYVVLSEFATLSNEESSAPNEYEISEEPQHDVLELEDMKETRFDHDEEMDELEFEDSEEDSDEEASDLTSIQLEDGSVGDILIGLKGSRFRFKDLRHAFGPSESNYLETQLHKYMRAVGKGLSEQMAYSLG